MGQNIARYLLVRGLEHGKGVSRLKEYYRAKSDTCLL